MCSSLYPRLLFPCPRLCLLRPLRFCPSCLSRPLPSRPSCLSRATESRHSRSDARQPKTNWPASVPSRVPFFSTPTTKRHKEPLTRTNPSSFVWRTRHSTPSTATSIPCYKPLSRRGTVRLQIVKPWKRVFRPIKRRSRNAIGKPDKNSRRAYWTWGGCCTHPCLPRLCHPPCRLRRS